jgi:hypothetical protein
VDERKFRWSGYLRGWSVNIDMQILMGTLC